MAKKIKVLHIGHSPRWRGGENQVRLLIKQMNKLELNLEHYLAYPKGSIIFDRVGDNSEGNLSLPSGSPVDLRSLLSIINFSKKNQIDILHAHSGNAHTLSFYAKYFLPQVKLVVHRRLDNCIKNKRTTRKKYLSDKVDAFIAISSKVYNNMKSYGIHENKIHRVTDSVNNLAYKNFDKSAEKSNLIKEYGWDINVPLIGFISALSPEKNPQLFIKLISHLKNNGCEVNAIIAGSGKEQAAVEALIQKHQLSDQIKMLGFVSNVKPLFSAIDIFILPSNEEGLGTVLLEASSAGAAVIASNVGGISEAVIDNKTGVLIEEPEVGLYAHAVNKLINDRQFKNQLVNNAKQHVDDNFSLDKMALDTAQLYKRILNN